MTVDDDNQETGPPYRTGFNADYAGKRAECDGGAPVADTKYAGRQDFTGTLTGDYRDFGDFPWRWYLMAELTVKPANYPHDSVWCEEDSLFFVDS